MASVADGDDSAELVDPAPSTEASNMLPRELGVWGVVLMVVAAAAPLGAVAAALPLVFALSGTSVAPLYFALMGALLLVFVVGFVRMSRTTDTSGALYTYVRVGLGQKMGFGTAAIALLGYVCGLISIVPIVGYLASETLADHTKISIPWWIGSFLIVAVFAVLGYRDIDLSAKVLGVALVIETIIVLIFDVVVLGQGGRHGLSTEPFNPSLLSSGAVGLGLLLTLQCFAGFESTTIFRREAKDPDRTIPIATYIAVGGTGIFYLVAAWALAVGVGVDRVAGQAAAHPADLMGMEVQNFLGNTMFDIFQIVYITSLGAAGLTFHNVVTRYMLTLAEEGALPRSLGVVHPVHRAPSRASLILTVITAATTAVFAVTRTNPVGDAYIWMSGILTFAIVIVLFLVAVAVLAYFIRTRATGWWSSRVAPLLAIIGFGAVVILALKHFDAVMAGSQRAALGVELLLVAVFASGVVVGVVRSRRTAGDASGALDHKDVR